MYTYIKYLEKYNHTKQKHLQFITEATLKIYSTGLY